MSSVHQTGLGKEIAEEDAMHALGTKMHFDGLGQRFLDMFNPDASCDEGIQLALEQSRTQTPLEIASSLFQCQLEMPGEKAVIPLNVQRMADVKKRTTETLGIYVRSHEMVRAAKHRNKSTMETMHQYLDPLVSSIESALSSSVSADHQMSQEYIEMEAQKTRERESAEALNRTVKSRLEELEFLLVDRDRRNRAYHELHDSSGKLYSKILSNRADTLTLVHTSNAIKEYVDSIHISLKTQHDTNNPATTRRIAGTTSALIVAEERDRRVQMQFKYMMQAMNAKEVVETDPPPLDDQASYVKIQCTNIRSDDTKCTRNINYTFVERREHCQRIRQHRDMTCSCPYIPFCVTCLFDRASENMVSYLQGNVDYCHQRMCIDQCPKCQLSYCPFQIHRTSLPVYVHKKLRIHSARRRTPRKRKNCEATDTSPPTKKKKKRRKLHTRQKTVMDAAVEEFVMNIETGKLEKK